MKSWTATFVAMSIVFGSTGGASACCLTYGDRLMRLAKETAIIIWNDEEKIEHFIRRAEFEGKAEDFGFIFPSPTQPFRIAVANEKAFALLDSFRPTRLGNKSEAASGGGGGVEVLEEKIVGDYKATVFRASDGRAITNWLQAQGHKMRPAMGPWFDHYAKKGWCFTALKYHGRNGPTPTKAVCISFKADKPFYPFKMPSDTFSSEHFRPIDLFVLASTDLEGRLTGGKPWLAEKMWDMTLDDRQIKLLGRTLLADGPGLELPRTLRLTRYQNTADANQYDQDIVFVRSQNYSVYWVVGGTFILALATWRRVAAGRERR